MRLPPQGPPSPRGGGHPKQRHVQAARRHSCIYRIPRDRRATDNPGDADRISGGTIGTQARGSANAADASYFVPLNALAGGWDDAEGEKATGYAHYKDDPTDQFIMLASMTSMFSYNL